MARFEVYIPASDPEGMNLTLRVTADTWMAALKVGLKKIGDQSGLPTNVLCDIMEDESIHVTDSRTNRVFRILEIPEVSDPGIHLDEAKLQERKAAQVAIERHEAQEAAKAKADADAKAQEEARAGAERLLLAEKAAAEARAQSERAQAEVRAAAEEKARLEQKAREHAELEARAAEKARRDRELSERANAEARAQADAQENALRLARASAEARLRADQEARQKVEAEERARKLAADERAAAQAAERDARAARLSKLEAAHTQKEEKVRVVEARGPKTAPPAQIGRMEERHEERQELAAIEDTLSDLFERTPAVFDKKAADALYFLLDLALEKIPSDSGTFYLADLNRRDLTFAAVRGPKAAELLAMNLRVPMGRGLVGFCAQEGVAVAISDAQKDKRFFNDISKRLGYETHSMLTTPVVAQGRTLGAIQLINRKGSSTFTQGELAVLHYLAHQAATYLESQES